MLIKGKGLFPSEGHEWEFVTHVDHNESSLRGHNVERRGYYSPPPLSFFFSSYLGSSTSLLESETNFSTPLSLPEKWDFLVGLIVVDRSRNGSTPSLWMRTCRVDPVIIKKYYFCIIDAAGQMSISGVEEERKREKIVFRSASSCRIHPWETRRVDRFLRIDRTIELDSYR